jgi:hypothetical protein
MKDLAQIARRLGGEASGNQINCPGPGHSPQDRSLSIKFNGNGSFIVHSHAGDDWTKDAQVPWGNARDAQGAHGSEG